MTTEIDNPFTQFVGDRPSWATQNKRSTSYEQLLTALKQIGTTRVLRMSMEEFRRRFQAKHAIATIKNKARSKGMKVRVVIHGQEVCIDFNERPMYKADKNGVNKLT